MSDLPPATLPAYRDPPPPPAPEPTGRVFVVQLAGYLGLVVLDAVAWVSLADVVPGLGSVLLVLLGLLVAPFVALVLFELGELGADVVTAALRCCRRRRRCHGWALA